MLALLWESALRSGALTLAVWLGLRTLRITNPYTQMAVWRAVLMATLAMPLLMQWKTYALPAPAWPVSALVHADIAMPMVTVSLQPSRNAVPRILDWQTVAFAAYLLVVVMLGLRLLVGIVRTWRLRQLAQPLSGDWVEGRDVRASAAIRVPVTFGSTILLPVAYTEWSAQKRRAVLAHEAAHVARGDFFILLLAALNRTVFWLSPTAWWLDRKLAHLAEAISDAAAIEIVQDRLAYAEILLDMATGAHPVPAAVPMARPRMVTGRVERILAETKLPAPMSVRKWLLVVIGIILPAAITAGADAQAPSANGNQAADLSQAAVAQRRYEQARPRQEVPIDPALLDNYVGYYQMVPGAIWTVTSDGSHLFVQATAQQPVEVFPDNDDEFFYKLAPAQITFVAHGQGPAEAMILHSGGFDRRADRISQADAEAAADSLAQRIQTGTPNPGSEAALRTHIEAMLSGQPDYDQMGPLTARAVRENLPISEKYFQSFGALQSMTFKGVGVAGWDVYDVQFTSAETEWRILWDTGAGKIRGIGWHFLP
jgi:beta-lactamase regulating signal transducer with metallopeptidase domain